MKPLYLLGLSALVAGCGSEPTILTINGETMGTTYNITAVDAGDVDAETLKQAVEEALAAVNGKMSNWDPNSEVSVFSAMESTEPVEVSAEFATVIQAANEVHDKSQGRFDVTLGPLIELWGFGPREPDSPIPADADIEAALAAVGQNTLLDLDTEALTLAKAQPATGINLSAIAKGYGVDQVAATLRQFEIENYMVEIGGDLITAGKNPDGEDWRIGIERPDSTTQTVELIVNLSGMGMATSGDYRNYFEEEGVRYSHILDATTGRPITHETASVTVLAESAMMADAWATAFLALGEEQGMQIAEENNIAVLFINRDEGSEELAFATSSSSQFDALEVTQ